MTAAARQLISLPLIAALLLLAPHPARADRREVYLMASLLPGVAAMRDPDSTRCSHFGGALELSALYGLDNDLHLGGALQLGGVKNVVFASANPMLPDGSSPGGQLYEDAFHFGLSASLAYRFDFNPRWAPVARLDLGLSVASFGNRSLVVGVPTHSPPLSAGLPSKTVLMPGGRLALLAQRRLGNSLAFEAGIALRGDAGARGGMTIEFPLTAAWIF
jgi:hypothetical protein